MDPEEHWRTITEQRLLLADLLDGLSAAEWEAPSLCGQWRVRDVAAHVALTPLSPSPWNMLVGAAKARFDFDGYNRDLAVEFAARPTAELVALLRGHADDRRRAFVTTYRNLHFDVMVHVQDIAVPLGRTVEMPPAAARLGADRVWEMGWPFWAKRRLRGVRLVASDVDWSVGAGAEVTGPIQAMLLLLTGRTETALPHLSGTGVGRIAVS